jgi:pantoate--beta-alanine ligase
MILFKKAIDLRKWLEIQRKNALNIGFVPTMGALHQGHLSLIEASKKQNPVTVSSIFINPTQFNDPKDFEKYPVTIEKDIALLEEAGCDILFLPSVKEIYPNELADQGAYDLGYLESILEGKFRPGHFQGVCMVVHRLLDIVRPNNLYLGQKDYQQCMVIKKLLELTAMNAMTKVVICPILREPSGLAMSSRNMRLTDKERTIAAGIYQCLSGIKQNMKPGPVNSLLKEAYARLEKDGFRPDYISIADTENLSPVEHWDGHQKIVALIAAFLGEVRLIDNRVLN